MKFQQKCPKCEHVHEIGFWKWLWAPHMFDIWRWLKCPKCGQKSWSKTLFKKENNHG